MLNQELQDLMKKYKAARPDEKIGDPIVLAVAARDARDLRDQLDRFLAVVRRDESLFLSRFSAQTSRDDLHLPSRFAAVPRQSTIVETLREFVRRNRGEEFTATDVLEACDLHGTPANTIRGLLARLRDQGEIRRPQRGVYKALPRKPRRKAEKPNA